MERAEFENPSKKSELLIEKRIHDLEYHALGLDEKIQRIENSLSILLKQLTDLSNVKQDIIPPKKFLFQNICIWFGKGSLAWITMAPGSRPRRLGGRVLQILHKHSKNYPFLSALIPNNWKARQEKHCQASQFPLETKSFQLMKEKILAVNEFDASQKSDDKNDGHKPKLAYVSPMPPAKSGAADCAELLVHGLKEYYDIDIISEQENINFTKQSNFQLKSIVDFEKNAGSYDRVIYHIGNNPLHKFAVKLLIKIPGVVVLHDVIMADYQRVIDFEGWKKELYYSYGYGVLRKKLKKFFQDGNYEPPCNFPIIDSALGVLVHSRHAVDIIENWHGKKAAEKLKIMPLVKEKFNLKDPKEIRKSLGFSKNAFIICSFGFLSPLKLNHKLLESFISSNLAQEKNVHLIFVGEYNTNDYGVNLKRKIQGLDIHAKVEITGWVDRTTYEKYLSVANLAVQLRSCSRGETSASVLDCLVAGIPLIVNAHGSMCELEEDAVYKLDDKFKKESLKIALEALYQNQELRNIYSKNSQNQYLKFHSIKNCARECTNLVESIYKANNTFLNALKVKQEILENQDKFKQYVHELTKIYSAELQQKQLFVDISDIVEHDLRTGIQRVIRAKLLMLIKHPPKGYRIEPVYLKSNHELWPRYARQYTQKLLGVNIHDTKDDFIEIKANDIFYIVDLKVDKYLNTYQQNFFHLLRQQNVKTGILIHDLLPATRPEYFPKRYSEECIKWFELSAMLADTIVFTSQTTKNEFKDWVVKNKLKVNPHLDLLITSLGSDIENSVPTKGVSEKDRIMINRLQDNLTFLMVGTIEPRKGYRQLLKAFDNLWKDGYQFNLAIVGKKGWSCFNPEEGKDTNDIIDMMENHPLRNQHLYWFENVSDECLQKIYKMGDCLIYPSEAEGFGLPLIEAVSYDLPIIVRDIPIFREVIVDDGMYFSDSLEPKVIESAVKNWFKLYQENKTIKPKPENSPTWQDSLDQFKSQFVSNIE